MPLPGGGGQYSFGQNTDSFADWGGRQAAYSARAAWSRVMLSDVRVPARCVTLASSFLRLWRDYPGETGPRYDLCKIVRVLLCRNLPVVRSDRDVPDGASVHFTEVSQSDWADRNLDEGRGKVEIEQFDGSKPAS